MFATFGSFTWAPDVVKKQFEAFAERLKLPVVASLDIKQSLDSDTRAAARKLATDFAAKLTK